MQCSAEEEKIARRERVWRNAMQGQWTDEQMVQGWVVRFVMLLVVVAWWGKKEGGDGPTVPQVVRRCVHRTGRGLWGL